MQVNTLLFSATWVYSITDKDTSCDISVATMQRRSHCTQLFLSFGGGANMRSSFQMEHWWIMTELSVDGVEMDSWSGAVFLCLPTQAQPSLCACVSHLFPKQICFPPVLCERNEYCFHFDKIQNQIFILNILDIPTNLGIDTFFRCLQAFIPKVFIIQNS